ncbi:MAG: protein kinase [archaeon]|nr:protein kinase [archaeon]
MEETEKRDYNHICKVRDKERKDFYLTQAQLAILHHHAEEFSATPSLSLSGGVALKSNGAIVFGSLKELPQDVYASVGRMKVPEKELEEHLDIMANILSFADKVRPRRKFLTKAQHAVQSDSSFDREGFNNRHLPRMYVAPDELFKQIKVREVKKMFKICDYLGDGGYGNVVGAKVLGKQYPPKVKFVAIKYQDVGTSQSAKTLVAHEASFLKWADHPSICKFYDSIQVQSEVWIVTEMLEGGTLKEAAAASSQWSESSIAYVAAKMLAGISYLHENQLAHRDLKNLSVMFTVQAEVKLIDFGLCVDLCNGPTVAMIGSPFWMAPEMICGVPHSFPVDIWSFMVCMLELANRRPPDCKNVRRALFKHAVHGMGPDSALEKPDQWTDTFKAFLASGFHMNPAERSTAADLLKHPFLEKINSRENMCKMLSGIFLDKSVVAGGIL